jgi:toxin ParE1/3/4
MPESYRIHFTTKAAADLEGIFDYVEKDSPQNATRLIQRLLDAIGSLKILPHRNRIVKDTEVLGECIRSMPVRPYLIRYHVKDSTRTVTILSVRHGARRAEP